MVDEAHSTKTNSQKFVVLFTFFLVIFTTSVQVFLVQREIGK